MRTRRSALTILAASLLAAAPLTAQEVVDQNQATATTGFAGLDYHIGQTFVQSGADISGFGVFLQSGFGSMPMQNLQFAIYDAVPSLVTPGHVLVSGTQVVPSSAGTSGWVDFHFSPYSITPGTALFLMVTGGLNGVQVTSAINTGGTYYPSGQAYSSNDGISYITHPQEDLTFRTYTTLAQPVTTPEPASLTLLATGLVGIAGAVRHRRRNA